MEDYVATMAGVGNLLQQQGELINKMGELLKEKQGEEVTPDQKKEEKGESASSSSIQIPTPFSGASERNLLFV